MQARGSIGAPAVRWLTIRRSMHDVGLLPGHVHVLRAESPLVSLVGAELLVDERRAVFERRLGVDDHGQRLVLDEHILGRVDDRVLVLAEDGRHGLTDVLDLAAGQRPVLGGLDLHTRRDPRHRHPRGQVEVLAR